MKNKKNISRADALKKMGKYSALTAVSTFTILSPLQASTGSGGGQGRPGQSIWKD